MNPMAAASAAVAAVLAAGGSYLLYSAVSGTVTGGRSRARPGSRRAIRSATRVWLDQAGIGTVSVREFVSAVGVLLVLGTVGGYLLFAAAVPALIVGFLAASFPVSAYRRRRQIRLEKAGESWPTLLEEMRLRTGSLGRSVPQALFESGRRAPEEWRPALAAAEREWLLTTDFSRTASLLKDRLADPSADAILETLLLAHEVGGTDLDSRLADLIEDRIIDLQNRKDSATRQAGVRFARRFVLLVPLGMALAGLTIGTGRQAYASTGGQIAVAVGLLAVAGCWAWSGRLMRLPRSPRVFR